MSCPCGCIAIRLLFYLWHASSLYPQIHRSRRGKPRFGSPPRLHKKRLRTSQDYSGRMASDLQGHSESFRVIPCLSATTLMEIQEVQVGKSARQ
jgi:hypothetical protein